MLTRNAGTLDRIARALLGVALLAAAILTLTGIWQAIASVAGIIMLGTAAVGICPLYWLFGFNTCPLQSTTKR